VTDAVYQQDLFEPLSLADDRLEQNGVGGTCLCDLLRFACATGCTHIRRLAEVRGHAGRPNAGRNREAIGQGSQGRRRSQTAGFVNAGELEGDPGLMEALEIWRAAKFPLGNHAYSRMNLHASTVGAFPHKRKPYQRLSELYR